MLCHIYRSSRRQGTYLYLRERDAFTVLPPALLQSFGVPEYAFSFELHAGRMLAQADTAAVLAAMRAQGFFLQLPPPDPPA
jgi:hypothetical protein